MPQAMKSEQRMGEARENPSVEFGENEERKRCFSGSTKRKRKVHFATLMDICHLKNAELEQKHHKYKGRVVLRGDMGKDDSGAYAVSTEQGSSASQMTAAKVMDVSARLLGCAGQAADAMSAHTQVKNGDRSKVAENSKVGMSRFLDTSSTTQVAQILVNHPRRTGSS